MKKPYKKNQAKRDRQKREKRSLNLNGYAEWLELSERATQDLLERTTRAIKTPDKKGN